jgi:uncharacterized membrane protein YbaN (DUF454 family)
MQGRSTMDRIRGYIYVVLGTIALAVGALGLLLPVLPTTPFVILAAACYYRGSERLHAWILNSRWFGEPIRNFQAGRGLTRNMKTRAVSLMWATIIVSAVFFVNSLVVRAVVFGVAICVTIYLFRLPTTEEK